MNHTESGLQVGGIVRRWVAIRNADTENNREASLFPALSNPKQKMEARPLAPKGDVVSKALKKHLKEIAEKHGVHFVDISLVGMRSLRRGGANAMREAGISDEEIKLHGRWTSDCFRKYFERSAEDRLRATPGF